MFDLRGHVALVTGGNSGIGLGMAHGLAQAGADVCIWGTNAGRNESAGQELEKHGTTIQTLQCDVSDEQEVEEAFAETLQRFGRVDSCFANAGIPGGNTRFIETTLQEFRQVMRVNLDGVFLTLRAAAAHMVDRGGGGVLVGTSSVSAVHGAPRKQAYAASKAGVAAMMRGLAVELARDGIAAHAVVAGWIETPMVSTLLHDETFETNVLKRVPMRRWGQADDFGPLAVYLASRPGDGYHTGDSFVVDGAYSIF